MPTIHESTAAMREGKLTPVDVLERCLQQIDRYEEKVRAWVLIDREGAREQAEKLTAELKKGNNRGPLHGIPIGVKDIIDVFDWPTAAGSKLWANSIARQDAEVVKKLRQAGAIILGKTVTTAYASFDPPITRNPWNLSRTPGGSSSGSAAAVACGMCLGALASQTGGSITRPASYCGVASIKPTYGRVSLHGVLPLAHTMDHVGAMARCAADLNILLDVLEDDSWRDSVENPRIDQKRSEPDGRPLRIGVCPKLYESTCEREMANEFGDLLKWMEQHDIEVEEYKTPFSLAEVTKAHQTLMAVEAAEYHEARFRKHPEDYPPRITSLITEGLNTSALTYRQARALQEALQTTVRHNSPLPSVLMMPATPGPAPDASTTGPPVFNSPWSFTGLPVVGIPFDMAGGLPLALQLVGRAWRDAELIRFAARLEKQINWNVPEGPP